MLALLDGPVAGGLAEIGVVVKDVAKVGRVVGAVPFDDGSSLDQWDEGRIDLGGVEMRPVHVGDLPMLRHPGALASTQ